MNSSDIIQITLPALCYRGLVPLPHNELKIEMAKNDSARTIKEVMQSPDKLIV